MKNEQKKNVLTEEIARQIVEILSGETGQNVNMMNRNRKWKAFVQDIMYLLNTKENGSVF
ncbi:hypothetical protein SAMN04487897_11266 [Paenibacillus sp. yr247]|uniref:hypothetical protein n=1 Tax=Paenibacillus sp. yr247 TaxID=1761880 RepID=UPI0008877BDC|nr:hypothetical protein [Paenibacillus sp. yr247]SDO34127.1 hypothetical protein SAMN04487897_11266 [Paenibacillus sp. yr247]